MLVSSLAERWGADPCPDGKTVWCEIGVAREAQEASVA
jgi:hypothetical protein